MTENDVRIAKGVIKSTGGYREKSILSSETVEYRQSETWNTEHKVIKVLGDKEPDGRRHKCEVDIVTRKITG